MRSYCRPGRRINYSPDSPNGVEGGFHLCLAYYLLSSFIKAFDVLHNVSGRKSRCFLPTRVWKFHLCEVCKWLGRSELFTWKGETSMSVPHITWVCPSGRPHQGSSGPQRTCGLWNGKVKWVLSSSHKNDNPCVKSHVGDKRHGGQGQQWAHRLAHQPAREMARWKDMAGRAGHGLEGTADSQPCSGRRLSSDGNWEISGLKTQLCRVPDQSLPYKFMSVSIYVPHPRETIDRNNRSRSLDMDIAVLVDFLSQILWVFVPDIKWLPSFQTIVICEISCLWTLFFFFSVRKGWWMLNMSQYEPMLN